MAQSFPSIEDAQFGVSTHSLIVGGTLHDVLVRTNSVLLYGRTGAALERVHPKSRPPSAIISCRAQSRALRLEQWASAALKEFVVMHACVALWSLMPAQLQNAPLDMSGVLVLMPSMVSSKSKVRHFS